MSTTNILHLSDLHIGDGELPCIREIVSAVNAMTIDMIIFTGDIFDSKGEKGGEGWIEEDEKVNRALEFFNDLVTELHVPKEDVLFVPGNHDYNRQAEKEYEIWKAYDLFLKLFYKDEEKFYRQCYLNINHNRMVIKDDWKRKILYLGFDSNYIDKYYCNNKDKNKKGKILIDIEQINKLEDFQNSRYEDYYKIAFFHHPCYLFQERRDVADGILANGPDFMDCMVRFGVKLFLHGHKHYGRSTIDIQHGTQIYMIAAGSIRKADNMNRSFNKISIDDNEMVKLIEMKSDNNFYYNSYPVSLSAPWQRGRLIDMLYSLEESERLNSNLYKEMNSNEKSIIQMIDQLYLEYDPLIILSRGWSAENNIFIDILLFSIQYRIRVREYLDQRNGSYNIDELKQSYGNNISKFKERIDSEKIKNIFENILDLLGEGKIIRINKTLKAELEKDLEKKKYVAFALLASFFTDLYLDFSFYWKDNIRKFGVFDENGLAGYCRAELDAIPIEYDIIRKRMYVRIKYSDMAGKKCAAWLIKKYRERCLELDNYFSCIKIFIERIDPEFIGDDDSILCDIYDAHIPNLIRLLTGKNVYESDLVFARELIQNAIDAVSFREKRENIDLKEDDKKILIEIVNNDEEHYFKISDFGIGMEKEIIRRYFTTLGRSYYKEYDFVENERLEYNSISNFGVGFLSVFRPCKKIIVQTKPFDAEVSYQLNIESGNDYFFLESSENPNMKKGTSITCYFKPEAQIDDKELCCYIREIMIDIKYPIHISLNGETSQEIDINARAIRRNDGENVIYIPFDEDKDEVIYYERESKEDFRQKFQDGTFRHGILIRRSIQSKSRAMVLNAGILMKNTCIENLFFQREEGILPDLKYHDIIINFPPGWMEIDMSREKVNRIKEKYKTPSFLNNIYMNFKEQMKEYKNSNNGISLAEYLELENIMRQLFSKEKPYIGIKMNVSIEQGRIKFALSKYKKKNAGKPDLKVIYNYGIENQLNKEEHKILQKRLEERLIDSNFLKSFEEGKEKISDFLYTIGILELEELNYFPVVLAAYLPQEIKNENMRKNVKGLKKMILERCTVRDLKKEILFSVNYDSKEEARVNASEVRLQKIIEAIVGEEGINRYDYIWEQIIYSICKQYFDIDEKNLENIREYGQPLYEQSRDNIKDLYIVASVGQDLLINCCMIASCYTKALLQTPNEYIDKPKGRDNKLNKYKWILDSALKFIYIWKSSEYLINQNDENEKKAEILKLHDNLLMPDEKYDSYIKILALNDTYQEKFDLLSFAELLKWVADYNDEIQ